MSNHTISKVKKARFIDDSIGGLDGISIGEISAFIWCVVTDVKPASQVVSHESNVDNVVEYISRNYPDVKTTVKDGFNPDFKIVFIYKHDHVKRLIDEAFRIRDIDRDMYHILSGYVFGIPSRNIEDFLQERGSYATRA